MSISHRLFDTYGWFAGKLVSNESDKYIVWYDDGKEYYWTQNVLNFKVFESNVLFSSAGYRFVKFFDGKGGDKVLFSGIIK